MWLNLIDYISHIAYESTDGKYEVTVWQLSIPEWPPARGGGKTNRIYATQGKKISNHEIQLTIQGQTISSRYGTKEQFLFNCDQLLTAGQRLAAARLKEVKKQSLS
jgi:hypothetical protein